MSERLSGTKISPGELLEREEFQKKAQRKQDLILAIKPLKNEGDIKFYDVDNQIVFPIRNESDLTDKLISYLVKDIKVTYGVALNIEDSKEELIDKFKQALEDFKTKISTFPVKLN